MLTDPKLRAQVDTPWDKFWTGELSNPLDAIEEFASVMALVESLRGRISVFQPRESTRQVEGLFESLLAEALS